MTQIRALLVLVLLAVGAQLPAAAQERAPVILISIDGFRADYLDRGQTPTLLRLAQRGARAAMRPSFPSVTFPNHYALVTGRRPDRNGVIHNRMEDAQRPGVSFSLSNIAVAADPIWWQDATPIWVTAERAGVRTGTMFWPGSDYELHGVRPTRWRVFDQTLPSFARVDELLGWLDLPADQRPLFFTLYFDLVDTAGHRYGPDAFETAASAGEIDAAMARLIAGLAARRLANKVNLVIVGDHGMANVSAENVINIDAMTTAAIGRVIFDGPVAGITAVAGHEDELAAQMVGRKDHGECWRKESTPERFHYGTHQRVPTIVCLADIGWAFRSPAQMPPYAGPPSRGAHGFDNDAAEMRAIFIANGPAFRRGVTLPTFDNVSVYPLLARLIGIEPEANDGTITDVQAALK